MKVGIIGYGYWGKILHSELVNCGLKNFVIYDEGGMPSPEFHGGTVTTSVKDLKEVDVDYVFIATPPDTHFKLCGHFLSKGTDVFCEKPLAMSVKECKTLYNLASKYQARLFVDWTFTFNKEVKKIKEIIQDFSLGKLKSISLRRLNYGPERSDVNARWDLASHDVSILTYLLEEFPQTIHWIDYRKDKASLRSDSAVGVLNYNGVMAHVEASWKYPLKDRFSVFEFEKGFLTWDDTRGEVKLGETGEILSSKEGCSPLQNSIVSFFDKDYDIDANSSITADVTRILIANNENTI